MNIKKYTQKDRYGNMFSYEFDVPSMQEIPKPEGQQEVDPSVFKPKGTDTVPAMLTPGENVVNAEASRLPGVQPMLDKLNDKGRAIQEKQGGPIPSYNSEGTKVEGKPAGKDTGMRTVTDKKIYETPDGYKMSEQRITVGDNTHGYGHVPSIYNGIQYDPQQVEQMLYQGQIPQPDMRFKTPTEADYYARLNSQNLMNFKDDASYLQSGGQVPQYASAGSDLKDYLKKVEGVRNAAYQDSAGNYTVGVGNTDNVNADTKLTDAQVDERLNKDIAVVENDYKNLVDINLNNNQANSVKSLLFNIGGPNFAKSKARAALNRGDFETYKKEMLEFRMANGEVVPGLEKRRASELALFNKDSKASTVIADMRNNVKNNTAVLDGRPIKPGFMSAMASTNAGPTNDPEINKYQEKQSKLLQDIKGNDDIPFYRLDKHIAPFMREEERRVEDNRSKRYFVDEYGDEAIIGDGGNRENPVPEYNFSLNNLGAIPGTIGQMTKDSIEDFQIYKQGTTIQQRKRVLDNKKETLKEAELDFDKNKTKNNETRVLEALKAVTTDEKELAELQKKLEKDKEKIISGKEIVSSKSSTSIVNNADLENTNDPEIDKIKGIFGAITEVPRDNNKVDPKKVEEKEPEVDPTLVDKMSGWFGSMFKDMFSGPELARMAVSYVASRALGYDHGNSLDYSAKQYITRVDKGISERQSFVTNKDNLKTFTTESLKEYRETGDVSKLSRINKGLVAQGTGPMIYHDKYGPLPTFRTGKDTYAVEYNGQLYDYNDPKMRGFTSTYDKELHEPQKVSDFFKGRGVSSIKGANKGITEEGKGIDEGLAASVADKAANRYLKDAQLYGGNPEARSQLRLQMIKAQEEFWIDYGKAVKNGTTVPNDVLAYYNKRAIPMKTLGVVSNNDFINANTQAVQKLDDVILRVAQYSKDKTKRVSPEVEAKQYKQLWGALKLNWDTNSKGSKWENRMSKNEVDGNGVKNNSFTYWASKVLDTNAPEHAEAMKLLTNKFQLKSNQR